jgi:methylmalonyl-CoA/ethylmalonyl-CoA epimerase
MEDVMQAATADVHLDRIGQIAVPVRDIAKSVAFYRDVLGMRFLFEFPNLAFFDCGGVRLLLDKPETAEFENHSSVIYYKVDDIRASHAALVARGVEFIDEPHLIARMPDHELWMSFFRDPDQNVLALMCEIR